jgi:dihydrofolate synthase/folylpolyglutamate synthase
VVARTGGVFQHNLDIAETAAAITAKSFDIQLTDAVVESGGRAVRMAGRVEVMPCAAPRIILDGAHNPEKLTVALDAALEKKTVGKRVCLFGAIGAKAGPALVKPLFGRFDHIIATEPTVYAKRANPATATAALFDGAGCEVEAIPDAMAGFERALDICDGSGLLVVTGSFYLLSTIRERFYPKEQVVLQWTSFPVNLEK